MSIATDGPILHAQEVLKSTLEACAHFSGVITAYHGALPPPAGGAPYHDLAALQDFRPYAIISTPPAGFEAWKDADGETFVCGGEMEVEITRDVPANIAGDPAEVDRDFLRLLGLIIGTGDGNSPGLFELVDRPGMLPVRSVGLMGPARTDEQDLAELGDAQRAWLTIRWGHDD